jgi:hypothetical protein
MAVVIVGHVMTVVSHIVFQDRNQPVRYGDFSFTVSLLFQRGTRLRTMEYVRIRRLRVVRMEIRDIGGSDCARSHTGMPEKAEKDVSE